MRIAAIDVGTNTAQLLVAACAEGAVTRRLATDERFVRLGEGVDARGRIGDAALQRLIAALRAQQNEAETWGAEHIVVGATSASRDAENRQAVIDAVRQETGLVYEILSGAEEATWTFRAACNAIPARHQSTVVIDIGGGSTEIIAGTREAGPAAIRMRHSLDIGSVRLTERFFEYLPPSPSAVERATACIDEALAPIVADLPDEAHLMGTSGTTEALALVNAGPTSTLDTLDADARALPAEAVHRWRTKLLGRSGDAIRALHPEALRGRADVFPMGVLILDRFLRAAGFSRYHVSPYQLRHGLVLRWLHATEQNAP